MRREYICTCKYVGIERWNCSMKTRQNQGQDGHDGHDGHDATFSTLSETSISPHRNSFDRVRRIGPEDAQTRRQFPSSNLIKRAIDKRQLPGDSTSEVADGLFSPRSICYTRLNMPISQRYKGTGAWPLRCFLVWQR